MESPKAVLVTGANSGLGYETVKALLQSTQATYHVLVGCRTLNKAKSAIESLKEECPSVASTVQALEVDLTSDASIEEAFQQVKTSPGRLDILFNNAGATFDMAYLRGEVGLRDSFNKAYDVNVAGTHVLTHAFIPLLLKSADPRLIFAAGLSQITLAAEKYFPTPDLPAGWPKPKLDIETVGYRCSKMALSMLMLDWNHKLKADGVKVWGVSPGGASTNLGGMTEEQKKAMGLKHPSIAAQFFVSVIEGARDADVGKNIGKDRIIPW